MGGLKSTLSPSPSPSVPKCPLAAESCAPVGSVPSGQGAVRPQSLNATGLHVAIGTLIWQCSTRYGQLGTVSHFSLMHGVGHLQGCRQKIREPRAPSVSSCPMTAEIFAFCFVCSLMSKVSTGCWNLDCARLLSWSASGWLHLLTAFLCALLPNCLTAHEVLYPLYTCLLAVHVFWPLKSALWSCMPDVFLLKLSRSQLTTFVPASALEWKPNTPGCICPQNHSRTPCSHP